MSNRSAKRQRRNMWKKLDKKEAAILDAAHYHQNLNDEKAKKFIYKSLFFISLSGNIVLFVLGRV